MTISIDEFRTFRIKTLSQRELNISYSQTKTHTLECAALYYHNNTELTLDEDRLIADVCRTFNVPESVLRFVLGV